MRKNLLLLAFFIGSTITANSVSAQDNDNFDGVLDFSNGRVSWGEIVFGTGSMDRTNTLKLKNEDGSPFTVTDGICFLTGVFQPDEWGRFWLSSNRGNGQWVLNITGGHRSNNENSKNTMIGIRCAKF